MFISCYPAYSINQPSVQDQKSIEETGKVLQDLTHYEIDSSFLISQCMENVKNPALKDNLLKLKNESERNIEELSNLVKKYGGEPPAYSKDFKGFFMKGYAAMRGAFTDQGAIKALHTNSHMILKAFESALNSQLPADVKEIIQKIYENKKRSLQSLKSLS